VYNSKCNQEVTITERQAERLNNQTVMTNKQFNSHLETLKLLAKKTFKESEELTEYIEYIEEIQKKLEK
jgi:hypothetical protein